jgi:beta-N-acetylhexosaminidase
MLRPSLRLPKWCLFPLLILVLLFPSCDETEVRDNTVHTPEDPRIVRARAWADTLLAGMSLPEKAGQLMMVDAPAATDSAQLGLFTTFLRENHIGGIVLPQADRDVQAKVAGFCQQYTPQPLWIAFDVDAEWSLPREFPTLLALGAANSDSLAYQWGSALGAEGHNIGAQIAFSSIVKVNPEGLLIDNSPGSDPERVRDLSAHFLNGLRDQGLIGGLRAFPLMAELPPDTIRQPPRRAGRAETLLQTDLLPLQAALQPSHHLLQSTTTILSDLDSLPVAFSPFATNLMLREGMRYDDVVFSPSLSDPWWANEYGPGEAEVRTLASGSDVVMQSTDPGTALIRILEAVKTGRIPEAELDAKVRRILFRKALMGLDSLPPHVPDSARTAQNELALQALDWEISAAALTLLRDNKRRLPLRNNVEQAKIASLAIGSSRRTPMQKIMEAHAPIDHYQLGAQPTESACKGRLNRLKEYDYVLVGLHAPLTQQADTLPGQVRELLAGLESETRLVVAHFGNMRALDDLDTLQCVLAAYDDRERSQEAAGQFIWGGVTSQGRMPVQVCGKFCTGDGLDRGRSIRLAYVDPEAVGIDPADLVRVDSLLNAAIWAGTFPGCQVLAAKDGKVFLHKAYGHHDYTRARRVRLDDVYDIASVTKIAATTLLAMRAFEEDTLHLDAPLKHYLPELDSNFITIKDITPRRLMIHQAGLPPGLGKIAYGYYTMMDSVDSLRSKYYSPVRDDTVFTVEVAEDLYFNRNYLDTIWHNLRTIRIDTNQGYKYSDVSMFLMKAVLERIYGRGMDTLLWEKYYKPMGLQTAGYHPMDRFGPERIAPTEDDRWWRKQQLQGYVHDHSTALFGGVGGQAGLFSDARDLAIIMQMLLNEGEYGGRRYFRASTVRRFTARQPGSHRGLGFDMQRPVPEPDRGYCCISASPRTFGHFGFTGTCTWADPENNIVYVLLTNRVYPRARNWKINTYRVRQTVQQAIYDALGLEATYCVAVDTTQQDSLKTDSSLLAGVSDSVQ